MADSSDMVTPAPVAICGIGLRLPGSINTPTSLYNFLVSRKDARSKPDVPRYESRHHYFTGTGKSGSLPTEEGYWLSNDDVTKFDPSMFSMSPKEMANLDPQQRLLLQVVWEALENAAETNWQGQKIGCFVGGFGDDWREMHAVDTQDDGMYRLTGYMDFAQANRVSHAFDLRGPSMTVRTACSAGGLAVHLACQAIRAGECDSAIVAGSNLMLSPGFTKLMAEQSVLSPDASCKTFDASADGYARAEAVNCLFIKKLDAAIRDGNPIRAVIRGSATNSDGKTLGLTTPSAQAHQELIRDAYRHAGIPEKDMWQTAMVECHGTGTAVGDTIEANTVGTVFGEKGMIIGSVKPNLGHSEAASALTSIVKAVLSLETRTIIPNIKFDTPSVSIPFASAGLKVPTEPMPWPEDRAERIGINSFGIGGTNVHIIVESAGSFSGRTAVRGPGNVETPPPSPPLRREPATLLVFSAAHEESLKNMVDSYKHFVDAQPSRLEALSHTLTHRRQHLGYRSFTVVTDDCESLVFNQPALPSFKANTQASGIAFVFTGQGAQWARMGSRLLKGSQEFLQDIREMDSVLKSLPREHRPNWDIRTELMRPGATSRLGEAEFAQPICTALQIALVRHFARYGVTPKAVVGHSSGEIAAAYAAGVLTLKEAIIVAYYRGYTAKKLNKQGAMAAVGLGRDQVTPFLVDGVGIACENSNASVTLSGDVGALGGVCNAIKAAKPDALVRMLKVDKAYHSHHMRAVGAEYQALIKPHIKPSPPKIAFYSSVSPAKLDRGSDFGPEYWQRNLESPVLFRQAVTSLLQTSSAALHLEVGPHSALAGPLKQIYTENAISPPYLSALKRGANSKISFLSALGELHCRGVTVNFPVLEGVSALTDLPPYPWNLSKTYWPESRVLKRWQFPGHPPHELLGTRQIEDSSVSPNWRCMLSVDKVPWLRDHCVGSDIVLPAAGFVSMAGEAIRQLSGREDYTLRHVKISNALVLPPDQNVELFTSARRERLNDSDESDWWELGIQSCSASGSWTTHYTCQVKPGQVSNTPGMTSISPDSFLRSVETTRWYRAMAKVGYNYGPLFRGMRTIKASVSSPAADVEIWDDRDVEHRTSSNYSIHPRTIDQVLQSLIVAFHSGQPRLINRLYLPTSIDEVFVSKSTTSATFNVSTLSTGTMGSFQGDSVGNMNGKPVFFIKGLRFSPVELQESATDQASDSKAVQMSWKPDIDLVRSATLVSSQAGDSFPDVHKLLENLFTLCGAATVDDLTEIGDLKLDGQPHLKKHFEWLKRHVSTSKFDRIPSTNKRLAEIERIFSEVQMTPASSAATLIKRCYTHARSLFTSQLSPLELFLQDNALHELYDWMNTLFSYKDLFQLLSHKHGRHFRILEIGAGTGGLTARILRDLVACFGNGKIVGRYVFTDVSAGFFPAAKKRFEAIPAGFLDYRVLDISRDPGEQGFSGEKYDLIVASNVLHATPDLTQTLRHAGSLLKPNGRLLMHELYCETKWINWIMGYLSGWWLGEADNRPEEPYISPEQWTERLLAAGFSAPDVFYDGKSKDKLNATIIARPALQDAVSPASKTITLLTEDSQDHAILAILRTTFQEKGYTVYCAAIGSDDVALADVVVSTIDLCRGDGYFHDMTEAKLDAFKALLRKLQEKSAKLLWLTKVCQVKPIDPTYAPVLGVARTARVELGVSLATFEVDLIDGGALEAICRTVDKAFYNNQSLTEEASDMEFSYSSGQTLIPRCNWTPISHSLQALSPASSTKSLQITRPGALQTLRWTSRDLSTTLAPDSVRIKVHAAGLNFKDVVTAMGLITPSAPSGLGCEASGVVTQIGSSVTNLRLGDRVMVFAPQAACFSTDIHAPAQLCVRIPETLSFGDAAGMPCIFVTVLRALVDKAGLRDGQTVLIHSAAGGVGIAAMQIARWIGAKVFATVGSEDKKDFLVREWGLPRENIFSSRDTSFVQGVKAATDGRGVDVVLNSLSGELLHASWECVAPHGTFVELGKRDTLAGGKLAMAAFDDNRSFIGVEMANLATQDPSIVSRLLEQCVELYEKGVIAPVQPLRTFACGQIEDAFRYLYRGTHIGKVVIDLSDDALSELDDVRPTPVPVFRSDAAYMLVGGMGGLGSSIARWMASHGARDMTFLSRSAGTMSDDQALLTELQGMGVCTAAISCDIRDEEAVDAIISGISSKKKIAGVINLAMVLSDSAMSSMTLPQWQAATAPKIRGTWNLHRVLPADMDFFVLFGSVSGVHGFPGQANYAAANTFLDSFAQYRRGLELACSVLDLGGVEDVGYVSRAQDVEDAMRKAGAKLVSELDMLMGLQLAIAQSRPTSQGDGQGAFSGQVVVGLDCTVSIDDSRNRIIWKQDPRMVLYPDETEVKDGSRGKPGASGVADFVSYLQSHPQELDAPATMARLSREIALRVFGFLMREVDDDGIDTSLSPSALGVDSLMTIEIRNWWKHTIGAEVSVLQLTSAQSFDQLGLLAASQLQKKMASGLPRS
ncbi:Highly reducing polyketide synthase FUM1 [Colletotrichum trifolii]|uniref:Highly reducing polyketide synthase FUM1 n=1 Tax=Colletotrichum trifolii TaxID=5466 RepID=A0A4R8RC72_COLTR|nr:Highly reducing polyketide synthase FUM1 [Colletotrichum trifolii]